MERPKVSDKIEKNNVNSQKTKNIHVQSIFNKWALAINDSCTSSTTRTNQFLTILDTNFKPFFLKLHPQILRVSGFHSVTVTPKVFQRFSIGFKSGLCGGQSIISKSCSLMVTHYHLCLVRWGIILHKGSPIETWFCMIGSTWSWTMFL